MEIKCDQVIIANSFRPTTTRKALNCLQYSPNGKDIAGLSPRKTELNSKQTTATKLGFETYPLTMASKRASVSLPNVLNCGNVKLSKSATSTPQKKHISSSSSSSGILSPKKIMLTTNNSSSCSSISSSSTRLKAGGICTKVNKSNISIIAEEKENPNNYSALLTTATPPKESEQQVDKKIESIKQVDEANEEDVQLKEKVAKMDNQSVNTAVQCNLQDELLMTLDDKWESIYYFKLLFHKRAKALNETRDENKELNLRIDKLNVKNEELRADIDDLDNQISEVQELLNELKKFDQSEDNDDDNDYNEGDSGCDQ